VRGENKLMFRLNNPQQLHDLLVYRLDWQSGNLGFSSSVRFPDLVDRLAALERLDATLHDRDDFALGLFGVDATGINRDFAVFKFTGADALGVA
jgi:hypothetical protein